MGDQGLECAVKPEFLVQSMEPEVGNGTTNDDQKPPVKNEVENGTNNHDTKPNDDQNQKGDNRQKNDQKQKGRNKDRPKPMKFSKGSKLCPTLNNVQEGVEGKKCNFPNCQFQDDPKKYLEGKRPDIAEKCHVFETYGICESGLSCRFGSCHIKDNKFNVVNKEIYKEGQTAKSREKNHLSGYVKDLLRKKKYVFKTDHIVDRIYNERAQRIKSEEENENTEPQPKKVKINEDSDMSETKEERTPKRKIDWQNKTYLAPLTTVGNMPFRRICKKYGCDITCGEMAMTQQILQGHQPEWALVQRHDSEDIFGIQLCGCQPHQFGRVAQLVEDGHIDVDFVDLNLGCPIDLVYKRGMGSGLMGRKKPLEVMIKSITEIMNRPLTVKIRTGIYMDKPIADKLAPNLFEWGADMVTLHGRSREQRYTKLANWDYIGDVAEAVAPKPLFGNGDIINYEDYNEFKAKSGAAGCMLARGALVKPWVFTEIKEQRHWDISAQERLDMVRDYVNYGLEHWGSDDKGVETTRRFLLEWLSFLHRYVPVGILEKPPQRMNERVPDFRGRGDLETLLSSPKCSDWVNITEMFLGKVPDGFAFVPKHKAHGYKSG